MVREIFFEKDRKSANRRLKMLRMRGELTTSQRRKYDRGKRARLAKKQIPHIAGWKTWTF